uniref:Uncharacterized protein n=1 Tax=Emiliania huxleyi TaxID=2903 RepID=A0A7S3X297_EMIHU
MPHDDASQSRRLRAAPGKKRGADLRRAMRQPAIAEQRRRRTPHEIQKRNVDLWHGKEPSGYCTAGDSSLMMPWASGEGLVTSPKRAATFTRSNWSSGERERCAIIVDRHVHKNGGSTMRDIFLENERLGYGLYQGYTQLLWRQDFAVLQRIAERAVAEKRSPNHFIMMEAHFGFEEFANRPLSDLVRLKQLYQAAGVRCPIALMTRVREPLAYYLSFYKWGVAFRIQEALTKGEVQPQWGRNFSEWARQVPNLQSSIMVRGMTAMGAEYSGRIHASRRTIGPAGGRGWEELDNMLSKFDVVGAPASRVPPSAPSTAGPHPIAPPSLASEPSDWRGRHDAAFRRDAPPRGGHGRAAGACLQVQPPEGQGRLQGRQGGHLPRHGGVPRARQGSRPSRRRDVGKVRQGVCGKAADPRTCLRAARRRLPGRGSPHAARMEGCAARTDNLPLPPGDGPEPGPHAGACGQQLALPSRGGP